MNDDLTEILDTLFTTTITLSLSVVELSNKVLTIEEQIKNMKMIQEKDTAFFNTRINELYAQHLGDGQVLDAFQQCYKDWFKKYYKDKYDS